MIRLPSLTEFYRVLPSFASENEEDGAFDGSRRGAAEVFPRRSRRARRRQQNNVGTLKKKPKTKESRNSNALNESKNGAAPNQTAPQTTATRARRDRLPSLSYRVSRARFKKKKQKKSKTKNDRHSTQNGLLKRE